MDNKDKSRYNDSMALDPKIINSNEANNNDVHPVGIDNRNALDKIHDKNKKKK